MGWRSYFYYTRAEFRTIMLLGSVLLLLIVGMVCAPPFFTRVEHTAVDSLSVDSFLAQIQSEKKTPFISYDKANHNLAKRRELTPFPFDPNTIDSAGIVELGLPSFIGANLEKYRRKGGRFKKKEDFARLYGLSTTQYEALLPYIRIAPQEENIHIAITTQSTGKDSLFPKKLSRGTKVDLNKADTTLLKGIPGIGSVTARRIVAYREKLGGYVSVSQLSEVIKYDSTLVSWFSLSAVPVRKLKINKEGLDKLRMHPYMNFYKARAIIEYRKKRGALTSIAELALMEEFTKEELRKLQPYLSFE
ncbi:MAG: helix-hairpin-helix domain-containing protein [Phocaeicola sp.]|nr:helix-hairpin-helix domain-containing protein [Prevotellaceae bacterium]MDY3914928.1 helix-hairpin-helix domain-containing protein [Phocaeicola sp.]